jgi:hypothetical protein
MPITPDDDFVPGEDTDAVEETQHQNLTDLVRENPIGALIGAFVAGFLVARIL